MRFTSKQEQDDIARLSEQLANEKEAEIKLLENISHKALYGDPKGMLNDIQKYSVLCEKDFFEGKKLALLIATGEEVSDHDYRKLGTTSDFPASMTLKDGIWIFHLPPTPSVRNGVWTKYSARHIGYIVRNLIERYESETAPIEPVEDPAVVFEYGISENDSFRHLYDADNRDSKKILDCLTGTFFQDDNVLAVTTIHCGEKTAEPYTNVYVMERENLPSFAQKWKRN